MKTFRFDDICANTVLFQPNEIVKLLRSKYEDCKIIYAVSPLSHLPEYKTQRVFPKILTAFSDYKNFYYVDHAYVNTIPDGIITASHGLIHVDHRLLHRSAQEMSIVVSCSLTKSKIFVPPFNKWNKDTEDICRENGIELIKFEDGWLSMEHNINIEGHEKWYLHHWNFNLDKVKEWID